MNQGIARPRFRAPEEVVAWFGAVQAQDYLGSLWALGLRTHGATEASVEAAEARRAIVRTWPLRGTLHFVAAEDARWISRLLAPRVIARNSTRWQREVGIDPRSISRADEVVTRALEGGRRLPRDELYAAMESRRIRTGASRGLHLLLCLALRGRICLAGRVGKQQSFALLDEWIPKSREIEGDEAFAELAARYFASHGPATLKDFAWWAGITSREAQAAIAAAAPSLATGVIEGTRYWWRDSVEPRAARRDTRVQLLPAFDEYTVAYHDRSLLAGGRSARSKMSLLSPAVLIDGMVAGSWTRKLKGNSATITTALGRKLTRDELASLRTAAQAYGEFLGCEIRLAR